MKGLLSLQVYQDSTRGSLVADWTHRAIGTIAETDEHGFSYLSTFIPYRVEDAIWFYDATPAAHIVLSDGAGIVWEGRIEDRQITANGLRIGAFGYWRAFYDTPYTAIWSTQDMRPWRVPSFDELGSTFHQRFQLYNRDDELYIAPIEGESMTQNYTAGFVYEIPHSGNTVIEEIDFSYYLSGFASTWTAQLSSYSEGYANGTGEWTLTGTGSAQSGSTTVTMTNANDVDILYFNLKHTGATGDYTSNTGEYYMKIDAITMRGTTSNNVYADEIVKNIVAYVNGINSAQISSATHLIDSPNVAILEAMYEDRLPADILMELAEMGDDSSPVERYEVGVWEDQLLHFRQRSSQAKEWYTDIEAISLNSTLDTMYNSHYAVYRNEGGRALRTAVSDNTASQTEYGIDRRRAVNSGETDSTAATTWRDAAQQREKDITPRSQLQITKLFNASGARVSLYQLRSGDTLTIRNLPAIGSSTLDKIRSFRVARTSYDVDNNIMTPIPEAELPSLEFMVAASAREITRRTGRGFGFW